MIKSVEIKNFQSHKNTHIEFDPGLNIISGPSDSGKSGVLRALSWLIKNRPSGNSIKSWQSGKKDSVEVAIGLPEGTVQKIRSNDKAFYIHPIIGNLEAVGRDVPSEISELLNLTDFNIQPQHDPYMLLNSSPGQVAKLLNDLVGLSSIDSSLKALNSDTINLKRKVESDQGIISNCENEIEKLAWVDDAKIGLEELQKDVDHAQVIYREIGEVENKLRTIYQAQEELLKFGLITRLNGEFEAVVRLVNIYKEKVASIGNLAKLSLTISNAETNLQSEQEWLSIEKPVLKIDGFIKSLHDKIITQN